MIYRLLRVLMRYALQVFFRDIAIEGLENVPRSGPLLVAANHPNTLIDVLLVATSLERPVGFVAKSTLFKHRLLGAVLRALGAVPVYRKQDTDGDAASREGNRKTLEACELAVAGGAALLIFPEGVSKLEAQRLLELKTGLARIALGAEERAPGQVTIVPAALVYDEPDRFRSRARVRFLAPIEVAPFMRSDGDFGAVRALTMAVGQALRDEVVHVEDDQDVPLVRELDLLYGARVQRDAGGRLAASAQIARAVNAFSESEPERVERVRSQLQAYRALLQTHGVDDVCVRARLRQPGPLRDLAFYGSTPLALWGVLQHAIFYQLPRLSLKLLPLEREFFSTQKLLVGIVALGFCYALQTLACALLLVTWLPGWALGGSLVYLGTLPLCGSIALLWLEGLSSRLRHRRLYGARRRVPAETLRELQQRRESLIRELDRARVAFLAANLAETAEDDPDNAL